jgi:hypothetical protein
MAQQKTVEPSTTDATTDGPITLSVDAIVRVGGFVGSKLVRAGEPTPYKTAADVPIALRPFIINNEVDVGPAESSAGGMFQPGVVYNTDAAGHIVSRRGQREAARLAREASWQDEVEASAIAANELPPETQAALEDARAVDIALQIKTAEIAQARRDDQEAALRAGETAKPPELFVRRGAVFMHTAKAKLRPGETVFARQPSGEWWGAGVVDSTASLPPPEVTL